MNMCNRSLESSYRRHAFQNMRANDRAEPTLCQLWLMTVNPTYEWIFTTSNITVTDLKLFDTLKVHRKKTASHPLFPSSQMWLPPLWTVRHVQPETLYFITICSLTSYKCGM